MRTSWRRRNYRATRTLQYSASISVRPPRQRCSTLLPTCEEEPFYNIHMFSMLPCSECWLSRTAECVCLERSCNRDYWIAYRGSVVKCALSQVRAAHEHATEHMRDLGERLLHEGDFSYEDITGQDEPPWTGHLQKEKTQRQDTQDPMAKDRWMWTQKREDE